MMKFLSKIIALPISTDLKDQLDPNSLEVVEAELKRLQSEVAGKLSRLESVLKNELTKSGSLNKLELFKKNIRLGLAKWLYMTSIKK